MSRQSIIIYPSAFNTQDTISHYESFGWELLSINGNQITMSRETQNPVYSELVKLQSMYEEKLDEYKKIIDPPKPFEPEDFEIGTFFKTLLCLVIPCIIYTTYKIVQRNKYKKAFKEYTERVYLLNEKRRSLIKEMEAIALQGKTVFFSKQG